jgi:hypothetical protein
VRRMIRTHILVALVAATAACFTFAAPAWAGIGAPVIADCDAHDRLTKHYTQAELKNALATMPADVSEYTNCQQVIETALTAAGGGGSNGSGSGSGGSFLPTPVIVVLVLLILAAVTFGAINVRRRRPPGDGP